MKDIQEPQRNWPGYHSYSPRITKPYECVVCERRFFEYENMKEHQRRMHTESEIALARQEWTAHMEATKANRLKRQQYRQQLDKHII